MRRQLPTDDEVTAVMNRVLTEAVETGRRATVTAVERALDIPHATFDRNYRHLIEDFRQRVRERSATNRTAPSSTTNTPDQVIQRLRRENDDLHRLVKIYAESIRQLTLDNLDLETKLNATANITTLPSHRATQRPPGTTTLRPPGR